MGLGQAHDVLLADEGLATGEHVEMAAQLGALGHQAVHLLVGEVELVAVVGGPAAHAVLVAGARRVKQDDPGHVALVLLGAGGGVAQATEGGLVGTVQDGRLEHVVIGVVDDVPEELLPLGARVQAVANAANGAGGGVLQQVAGHVQELVEVLLAVRAAGRLDDLVKRQAKRRALRLVGNLGLHVRSSPITSLLPSGSAFLNPFQ